MMAITIDERNTSETSTTAQSQAQSPNPSSDIPEFWTMCPFCALRYRLFTRYSLNKPTKCQSCKMTFTALESPVQGPTPGKKSSLSTQEKKVLIQKLRDLQFKHPVASNFRPSFWTMCQHCECRYHYLKIYINKWFVCQICKKDNIAVEIFASPGVMTVSSLQPKTVPSKNPSTHVSGKESSPGLSCAVMVGEKRKRNEYGEDCTTDNQSKSKEDVIGRSVHNDRRGFNDNGDVGRREELGWKQLHDVVRAEETLPNATKTVHKLNKNQDAEGNSRRIKAHKNSGLCDSGSKGAVKLKTSECAGVKFNDFDKLREEVNFAAGQTWTLYGKADGMPRLYALIRKVLVPTFGLRITYLEPDPDDEKETQWFEEDLPVSVGKFRFGKNQNTEDRSMFSHVIHCILEFNEESKIGHFNVSPKKGETWALFKNWDIDWSSEPDSHRKFEYEFVEVLTNYTDGAGVSVAFLHKAKGFGSVFFRMRTGDADTFQILPHSLFRFSHRIPSFKLTGMEGKVVPKDAYELDQAALPETIEEKIVPSHLLAKPKSKPEDSCLPGNQGDRRSIERAF